MNLNRESCADVKPLHGKSPGSRRQPGDLHAERIAETTASTKAIGSASFTAETGQVHPTTAEALSEPQSKPADSESAARIDSTKKMTREDFRIKRHKLSIIAGMNQRYHQHKAYAFWWRDSAAKIITAVLAIAGFGLALASALTGSIPIDVVGVLISLAAAIAAIVLNVLPFGALEKEHVDAFRRWTDLREEVDDLEYDLRDGEPSEELVERLRQLDAKKQRICGGETLADTALLDACQKAEENSRHCPPCDTPVAA